MTDREILELVSIAAGLNYSYEYGCYFNDDHEQGRDWNPLTDDGDALRLAVKLGLVVHSGPVYSMADKAVEKSNGDPYAATRRAIVRAAAEIGKEHEMTPTPHTVWIGGKYPGTLGHHVPEKGTPAAAVAAARRAGVSFADMSPALLEMVKQEPGITTNELCMKLPQISKEALRKIMGKLKTGKKIHNIKVVMPTGVGGSRAPMNQWHAGPPPKTMNHVTGEEVK